MFKKIMMRIVYCVILIICLSLGVLLGVVQQNKICKLTKQIKEISREQDQISNMEKAMKVIYNISDFEAHYYAIIFEDFSKKDGVPWEIYASLIRIESNFNPTIMSPAKCKGLAQVSEGTAKQICNKLGITYTEATLWNEVLNLVIGLTYFDEGFIEANKLSKDDQIQHAIKRYCGGPGYSKINDNAKIYVGEYKTTVWQEYIRLSYIYKGILYDNLQLKTEQNSILQLLAKFRLK